MCLSVFWNLGFRNMDGIEGRIFHRVYFTISGCISTNELFQVPEFESKLRFRLKHACFYNFHGFFGLRSWAQTALFCAGISQTFCLWNLVFASSGGLPPYFEIFRSTCTRILQRPRIIVGDARCEPVSFAFRSLVRYQ